jgi:hypothetical protein
LYVSSQYFGKTPLNSGGVFYWMEYFTTKESATLWRTCHFCKLTVQTVYLSALINIFNQNEYLQSKDLTHNNVLIWRDWAAGCLGPGMNGTKVCSR